MAKRVTIEMVAREAGVSRGTVDRVINQRSHVRQDQYDRVLEAIRKLGYEPKKAQASALGISIAERDVCRLGVVLPSRNPYYLEEVRRGIRDAQAQLADYSVEVLTGQCSSSPYPEEVVGHMDALVEQGARGIVLCAMDCEPVAERIDLLYEQNIPVITFDTDIRSKRLLYFGKDPARSGRVAGALMTKYTKANAEGRVLAAMGNREIGDHMQRMEAFLEVMSAAGFPEEKIEVAETFGDYSITYRKVRMFLEKEPAAQGIFMANHSLTGCMDAIRAAGGASNPFVIFSDMNERVHRYLQSGELAFCVTPNAYMMGYQTLLLLKDYILDGEMPSSGRLFTPIEIVCRENMR